MCLLLFAAGIGVAADQQVFRDFLKARTSGPQRAASSCPVTDLVIGTPVDGAFTTSDCFESDLYSEGATAARADAYKLTISADLIVQVDVKSTQFEPYVTILDASGRVLAEDITSGTDKQATAIVHLAPGAYTVVASTAANNATGSYVISASGEVPHTCVIQNIKLGDEVNGAFESSDCRLIDLLPDSVDITPLDIYNFEVIEKGVITARFLSTVVPGLVLLVDVSSGSIVTYTRNPSGNVSLFSSLNPGVYQLYVVSANYRNGAYKISTTVDSLRTCPTGTINSGDTIQGALISSDCRDLDLFVPGQTTILADPYVFEVKDSPVVATLTMRSTTFDSFLSLGDSKGRRLAYNDDFEATSVDAQIKMSLAPGSYSAVASHATNLAGAYSLKFETEPLRACPPVDLSGGQVTGSLVADDCRVLDVIVGLTDQTNTDLYKLHVDAKAFYTLDLSSTAFTPALRLYDKNGVLLYSLTAPATTGTERRSKFDILLAPGDYRVLVMTRDRVGDYQLTTSSQEPKVCEVAGKLDTNASINGALTSSDCTMTEALSGTPGVSHVDQYRIELKDRTDITFTAESKAFAPTLLMYTESGELIAFTLNTLLAPKVSLPLSMPAGVYTLAVVNVGGTDGDYTVSSQTKTVSTPGTAQ